MSFPSTKNASLPSWACCCSGIFFCIPSLTSCTDTFSSFPAFFAFFLQNCAWQSTGSDMLSTSAAAIIVMYVWSRLIFSSRDCKFSKSSISCKILASFPFSPGDVSLEVIPGDDGDALLMLWGVAWHWRRYLDSRFRAPTLSISLLCARFGIASVRESPRLCTHAACQEFFRGFLHRYIARHRRICASGIWYFL